MSKLGYITNIHMYCTVLFVVALFTYHSGINGDNANICLC